MVIYYSAHIFGCLWWAVSRYDVENSWWVLDGLVMEDTVSTYIASLYWAATTITTVNAHNVAARPAYLAILLSHVDGDGDHVHVLEHLG